MWRWEGVREDVKMRRCERRCEDEKVGEKMWRWEGVREDVKMRRCERRCEDEKVGEKMWRWEGVREDVKMRRCERRCEDEKVWEKMWRWEGVREDVKMRRCERRYEDEKVWRWEDEIQTPTIGRTLRSDALGKKAVLSRQTLCPYHKMRNISQSNKILFFVNSYYFRKFHEIINIKYIPQSIFNQHKFLQNLRSII